MPACGEDLKSHRTGAGRTGRSNDNKRKSKDVAELARSDWTCLTLAEAGGEHVHRHPCSQRQLLHGQSIGPSDIEVHKIRTRDERRMTADVLPSPDGTCRALAVRIIQVASIALRCMRDVTGNIQRGALFPTEPLCDGMSALKDTLG